MRNATRISLLFLLVTSLLMQFSDSAESALKNPEFSGPQAEDGSLNDWYRRTQNSGYVKLMEDKGNTFVRIGVENPGEESMIAQTVEVPEGAKSLKVVATVRYDIKKGSDSWHMGRFQGEFKNDQGKRTGGYQTINMDGTQAEWTEIKRLFVVPKDAVKLEVKLALFQPKEASHLDFKKIDAEWYTEADLEKERAKYRPAEPFGEPVSEERFSKLARGININNWFGQPYNAKIAGQKGDFSPRHFQGYIIQDDIDKLKQAGFTHVRLPVEPAPFMNNDTGELKTDLLPELDRAIKMIVDTGLAVIVDAHPKTNAYKAMRLKPELAKNFVTWWGNFAKYLAKTTDPEWVFLEPLNEPGGQKYYGSKWTWYQDKLIMTIAEAAPRHTIICNAGGWQQVKDTIEHDLHPYRNVVFAVHFYLPSQFTHQGAVWMSSWYQPLKHVPWPLDESNLQVALDNVVTDGKRGEYASRAKKVLKDMIGQKLGTKEIIQEEMAELAEWSKKNERYIVVDEFGVYKPFSQEDDRLRWLNFVRSEMEKYNFGWSLWEYAHEFGFAEGEPGEREYDAATLQALGLNAVQSEPVSASP